MVEHGVATAVELSLESVHVSRRVLGAVDSEVSHLVAVSSRGNDDFLRLILEVGEGCLIKRLKKPVALVDLRNVVSETRLLPVTS